MALSGSVKLDHGDREVGQRIYAWFTLTNSGGQPLELEGIRLAVRGPGKVVRDMVSDEPLTLAAGQSLEVSSDWPLDLAGRWHGWIEVTQGGEQSLVGDEQAFGFWVRLPKDLELQPLGAPRLDAHAGALSSASLGGDGHAASGRARTSPDRLVGLLRGDQVDPGRVALVDQSHVGCALQRRQDRVRVRAGRGAGGLQEIDEVETAAGAQVVGR